MDNIPVIEFENVSFSYDTQQVFESVTLAVTQHDFVSIVGPNGSGKTTMLKLMLGLLRPSQGTVRILGKRPEEARPRVGYMPQHAHLDPQFPVSAMEVVLMGRIGHCKPYGSYSASDRNAAEQALRQLHIWDLRDSHFSALSGGQRQRVLIARALASEPDLLLLDEPTAGLDPAVGSELFDILKVLTGILTVALVSHDLGFVSHYVNKVICVKRNAVVHPTTEITGEMIHELYGTPMRMVRHDQANSTEGDECRIC